jgi:hypothetical protein
MKIENLKLERDRAQKVLRYRDSRAIYHIKPVFIYNSDIFFGGNRLSFQYLLI